MDSFMNSLGSSNLTMMDQIQAIWKSLDEMSIENPEKYTSFINEQMAAGKQFMEKDTTPRDPEIDKHFQDCLDNFLKQQDGSPSTSAPSAATTSSGGKTTGAGSASSTVISTLGKRKDAEDLKEKKVKGQSRPKKPARGSAVELASTLAAGMFKSENEGNAGGDKAAAEEAEVEEIGELLGKLELPAHVGPTKVDAKKGQKLLIEELN